MNSPLDFAKSVLRASGDGTTHLKLQKLLFYAYGAAKAYDEPVPLVQFRNWQHGPVCVEVYEHFKDFGSHPLPVDPGAAGLPAAALHAVRVYGALSAWQLRNESHLEAPWLETSLGEDIEDDLVVSHFAQKFKAPVRAPRNLAGSWSLSADQLPALTAGSLCELATALGR